MTERIRWHDYLFEKDPAVAEELVPGGPVPIDGAPTRGQSVTTVV